jgi:hypothetical protein
MSGAVTQALSHSPEMLAKFWARVDKRAPDECWPWLGGKHPQGYGRFHYEGKSRPATRVAWEIEHNAPFPDGMFACHSCDNPPCVNPAHLWPGTNSDNIRDAVAKGRHASKPQPFCKQGHEIVGDNVELTKNGRRCRICSREKSAVTQRRWNQRKRELKAANSGITQAARDAAADLYGARENGATSAKIRRGELDHFAAVQAFAKAIADERERCARIADDASWSMPIDEWMDLTKKEHGARACKEIATAIRASGVEGGR